MGMSVSEGFVHLRTRSAYSLLEGAIKADYLGKLARTAGMPAVALTDRANLFGALEFSVATQEAGVQPIVGCALPVSGIGEGPGERWARVPTVVLLAQNAVGYRHLTELSSAAFLDVEATEEPHVPWSRVAELSEGLILLSGGPDGPVDPLFAAGRPREAEAALAEMHRAFGTRFYVELQRHGLASEAAAEPGLVAYAYAQVGIYLPHYTVAQYDMLPKVSMSDLQPGDIIVQSRGRPMHNPYDWEAELLDLRVGERVPLLVRRGTQEYGDTVQVADLPSVTAPKVEVLKELQLVSLTPAIRAERAIRSTHGAVIYSVTARVSDELGIRAGDVILQVNRTPVAGADQAARALNYYAGRGLIRMYFEHNGQVFTTDFNIQ